jgi:hypothetical protein
MQTPVAFQNPQAVQITPSRQSFSGLIPAAFIISLIAFILTVLTHFTYDFVISPAAYSHIRPGRDFYNGIFYIPAFLGFIGFVGFILGLIGVISAIKQKAPFKTFLAFASLALGFVGFLTMIEYTVRFSMVVLK